MADFTDRDKQALDALKKAYEKAGDTSPNKDPWQELFDRDTSINTSRAAMAADIVKGFAGSWAASYNYGLGAQFIPDPFLPTETLATEETTPIPVRAKTTKLGLRGVSDIDFVPYNWRTNRFGSKGPSLVGHPISYEVEGPTLKSPFTDWTWQVQQGAGAGGGDLLTIDTRPDGGPPTCSTIAEAFNLPTFSIGDAAEPNGGLYLIVSDDGVNPGSLPFGNTPMGAQPLYLDTARYEIFRISDIRTDQITIHPSKSFGRFFDLPPSSTRYIRAITIIRPYVTRLAAIPNSGADNPSSPFNSGREQSFLVVSPERAASCDIYPPYDGGTPLDGTWVQGGFADPVTLAGEPFAYLGRNDLPIPIPLEERQGTLQTGGVTDPIGRFRVLDTSWNTDDSQKIFFIYHVNREDGAEYDYGDTNNCFGYYPVFNVGVGAVANFLRVAEIDPATGFPYFGPGPVQANLTLQTRVYMTSHEKVSTLWEGAFNIDKMQATRLKNLIDPRYVERHEKQISDPVSPPTPGGAGAGRPDRAIFNTTTFPAGPFLTPQAADPGSLLDLGFRMVLFPAKEDGGGNVIPDFDKPITSREITIDPLINEPQFVDIDYSAGIVRLSHPPDRIGGDIIPNGVFTTAPNNPRGEVVLFAACVPYSMEDSQVGTGNRVVQRDANGRDLDLYSPDITARIDTANTNFAVSAPFIGPSAIAPNPVEIVLDRLWEGPSTGTFDIITPDGSSFGVWGYTETRQVLVSGKSVTTLGGISSRVGVSDPTPGALDVRNIHLRREVIFAEQSAGNANVTDLYVHDTTYGSSARAKTIRFDRSEVNVEVDGSVTVRPLPGLSDIHTGYMVPSNKRYEFNNIILDPTREALSENGFLERAIYQDQLNPANSGDPGILVPTIEGPQQQWLVPAVVGNYRGFLNDFDDTGAQGVVRMDSINRFVFKFQFTNRGTDANFFMGLVGTRNGANTPDVNFLTTGGAVPTDIVWVGLRAPNGSNVYHFASRGFDGITNFVNLVPTSFVDDFEGYLVIESSRDPANYLKLAIYDFNFKLLQSTTFIEDDRVPRPGDSLVVLGGCQNLSGASTCNVNLWYAHGLIRYDLVGPALIP